MEDSNRIQFREELKFRLKKFVLDLIKVCKALPKDDETRIIKRQLLRAGSSVYANYRAANRARSTAEFFSKISIVVEEADETEMWIDLLIESGIKNDKSVTDLYKESVEILKIMATIRKNTRKD